MDEYRLSKQLSRSNSKSMDYKARKRIEELYSLTDQILNEENDRSYKYDYKLYKKYKQLKDINRKLQEKIIYQHCAGCNCHVQTNEDTDKAVPFIDLTNSENKENKKETPLVSSIRKTEASSEEEEEEEEQTEMDTNEVVIEEDEEDENLTGLSPVLQDIIRNKVKRTHVNSNYLLTLGLYPSLCDILSDPSPDSPKRLSIAEHIQPLIPNFTAFNKYGRERAINFIRGHLYQIHKLYRSLTTPVEQKRKLRRRIKRRY